jgi:hypothetical protein
VLNLSSKASDGEKLTDQEQAQVREIAERVQKDNVQGRGKLADDVSATSNSVLVRDTEVKQKRKQITSLLDDIGVDAKPAPSNGSKGKKKPSTNNQPTQAVGGIPKATVIAMLDELRDAIMELLADEPSAQKELIARINKIATRL